MGQLSDSVQIGMTYAHYLLLEAIDSHDFTFVKKKVAQEEKITDQAYLDMGIVYLKRYYAIHVLDPLNPPAMSLPVDPFWHTHVLDSYDYTAFCNRIFGEYVHHIPLLYEDKVAVAYVTDFYNKTVTRHVEIFGDLDETFIPKDAASAVCCSPSGIGHLSALARIALFPALGLLHLAPRDLLPRS